MKHLFSMILLGGFLVSCPSATQPAQRPQPQGHPGSSTPVPCGGRYYILASAMLAAPWAVIVRGASNLPAGAILTVYLSDYIGEGSHDFNNEVRATVGKDGLFTVTIRPKKGRTMRANLICNITFGPEYPRQPEDVLRIVGRRGQRLGTRATNPQAQNNPSGTILVDTTVVTP